VVAGTLELHKQDLTCQLPLMIDARYHKDLVVKNTNLTAKEELVRDSLMRLPVDLHDFS